MRRLSTACVSVRVSVVVVGEIEGEEGLSSCALSIIHDPTLRKTEEGKVDRAERGDRQPQTVLLDFCFCLISNQSRRGK